MKIVKDWRGAPIERGSVVVYPTRQGSSLWMCEGVVTDVDTGFKPPRVAVMKKNGKRVSFPNVERITVIS